MKLFGELARRIAAGLAVASLLLGGAAPLQAGTITTIPPPSLGGAKPQVPADPASPTVPAPDPGAPRSSGSGIPALAGPVVDQAGILDARTRSELEALAFEIKQKTSAEMAVLTVRTTAPLDEFGYGMKVVEAWKLGSAEKDDGLLLLVAVDDRKVRFFAGYGLEGVLPDGRLGTILDRHVMPRFRAGDYPGGVRAGMQEIARILREEYGGEAAKPRPQPRGVGMGSVLFWLFLFFLVTRSMSGGRKRRRFHPVWWGGGFGGPMSGGFGGGFGGGRGGFGGGGFGGGFGGGGAGRSW